jgi:hypothetical protein
MRQLNENQIFQYNGSPITFQKGDSVMVNATEMAKPFGKRCNDFLSTKQTKELISSLSAKTGISATGLVTVNQGGNNQGTWMHEDLALVFAQWLSPDFYLWCNDRIKELLQYGMTATQPTLEQMINNPDLVISLATQLKSEREEKQRLALEVQKKEQEKQSIIEETVDKAFKKILFSFGSLRNCCTFAVLTVRQTLLLRRAAVNCSMVIGHFLCLILNDIRRLSIRSHCFVLRGKVCWTVSSVYGNRFSVVYNDLNAYSHE